MQAPRQQARQFEQAWSRTNQMLDGPPGMPPPSPTVTQPGGSVLTEALQHPSFKTTERLFRRLPEEQMFDPSVSPNRPFRFSLGAFRVPNGRQLWMTDYRFRILRFSGIDAGDYVYSEDGRFSGQLGFDLTISAKREGDLAYQLDPQPIVDESQATRQGNSAPFPGRGARPADFVEAPSESFASVAGIGNSLLPVTDKVQGPREGPFTIIVEENQVIELVCAIFRPLATPIAAFEGAFSGFQIHTTVGQALVNRSRPS